MQNLTVDEIASDFITQWAVRYGFLVVIQYVIDVGNHILAGENFEVPLLTRR